MIRVSRLTEREIVERYQAGEQINSIAQAAQVSRQAINNTLKRMGAHDPLRGSAEYKCRFCGDMFRAYKKRMNKEHSGYCSVQCFHADRSLSGQYSRIGSQIKRIDTLENKRKHGWQARKVVEAAGIELKAGQVVHHIDGNRSNNDISNLMVFNSHAEHMSHHHKLRAAR